MGVSGRVDSVRPHTMPGAAACAAAMAASQPGAGRQSASRKLTTPLPRAASQARPALRATAGPRLAPRRSSTTCGGRALP